MQAGIFSILVYLYCIELFEELYLNPNILLYRESSYSSYSHRNLLEVTMQPSGHITNQ